MNTDIQTAQLIADMAAQGLNAQCIGESNFMIVPDGYKLEEVTEKVRNALAIRYRPKGVARLKDCASFITYAQEQNASEAGYIYADPDSSTITAVFNDFRHVSTPGWQDHRAIFKAEHTEEFARWLSASGKQFGQTEFAEFIEDNFADIDPAAAGLLMTVATTIQAGTNIEFKSARRLDNGQAQLVYNEVIDAKAGFDGQALIPRTFALGLRVYKNGPGYKLNVRLKYRLNGGKVTFTYELDRPRNVIEQAFSDYIEAVKKDSGYQVLIGVAP